LRKLAIFGKFCRLQESAAAAYSVGMTRRLHNWSYGNVTDFLKENGFSFYKEVGGSHQAWIKRGNDKVPDGVVGVHFTSKSYLVVTMKRMIRESGIDEDAWIKWGSS
jgi:hypothetical protein